ncbi:hypothetical protein TI39_contig4338g00003 [Zymoseptoria brevis]|uniref:Uncharacterized protein n=1 Tax=Zymoseptoria brevis TaxID=1047168 RepID=A0A0F4G7K2_9PEZI|nr:hypothetical protein TI39_contig4338g00003 [Zymoseptoria brevis]
MSPIPSSTPAVKLSATPILIHQLSSPPGDPIPAFKFTSSAALHAHQHSKKRFTLDWSVFRQHLVHNHSFDEDAGDEVVYAEAKEGFSARTVSDDQGLDRAFRQMRNGRGGVGFWLVKGGWRDSNTPVSREDHLTEAFLDGEDDPALSETEDEHVKKWQKGLIKAEPPINNMTTYA